MMTLNDLTPLICEAKETKIKIKQAVLNNYHNMYTLTNNDSIIFILYMLFVVSTG